MMKRKKLLTIALIAGLLTSMTACGSSTSDDGAAEKTTGGVEVSAEVGTDQEALDSLASGGIVDAGEEDLNSAMTDVPDMTDSITFKYVLTTTDTDTMKEFQVVYYGSTTKVLKAIHAETHFYKTAFNEEGMNAIDIEDLYPGISQLDFVKTHYEDKGDYFCYVIEYNELNDPDHLDQLYDCGCKIEANRGTGLVLSADSYKDLLLQSGATESGLLEIHSTYTE